MTGKTLASVLAVFTQFRRPAEAYRLLPDSDWATVMLPALLVVAICSYIPGLLVDWREVENVLRKERLEWLTSEGMNAAEADSLVSVELNGLKRIAESLPVARLVDRVMVGVTAGLAAFGVAYAVEGKKVGELRWYLSSSFLAQASYMLSATAVILLLKMVGAPPGIRPNLSVLVPVGTAEPGMFRIFIYRLLENIDIPSVVSLSLWGTGLSAMMGRNRGWGTRLVFSIYLAGILVVSMPALMTAGT